MNEESKKMAHRAVDAWGKQSQCLMLLEEMAELQKEVLKNINRGKDNLADMIQETADVEIMLEQLKYIYGIDGQVADMIPVKLEKTRRRLADEDEKRKQK